MQALPASWGMYYSTRDKRRKASHYVESHLMSLCSETRPAHSEQPPAGLTAREAVNLESLHRRATNTVGTCQDLSAGQKQGCRIAPNLFLPDSVTTAAARPSLPETWVRWRAMS